MCELFGLSCRSPVALTETPIGEFRLRGGLTADNPDGWGIAWRQDDAFQLRKEAEPASQSAFFNGLVGQLRAELVVAHVRKAKYPPVNTLNNTHPFLHRCCGRRWAFAHNGMVPEMVVLELANQERVCLPDGETDSEFAFCYLLSYVSRFDHMPNAAADWLVALGRISELIARHGKFNFLLSDGDHLIAYGHDRLHYLESADAINATTLIATEPLDLASGWTAFEPGELRIYRAGLRVGRMTTHPPQPQMDPQPVEA